MISCSRASAALACPLQSRNSRSVVASSAPAFSQRGGVVGATQTASPKQRKTEAAACRRVSGPIIGIPSNHRLGARPTRLRGAVAHGGAQTCGPRHSAQMAWIGRSGQKVRPDEPFSALEDVSHVAPPRSRTWLPSDHFVKMLALQSSRRYLERRMLESTGCRRSPIGYYGIRVGR
jgi:hypothetical protein